MASVEQLATASDMAMPTQTSTVASKKQECHLTSLPPELRNRIYDLIFIPEPVNNLLTATPPFRALLATCQQIYTEANGIYRAGYRAFWTATDLLLNLQDLDKDSELQGRLTGFIHRTREQDITHIGSLRITGDQTFEGTLELTYQDGGLWRQVHAHSTAVLYALPTTAYLRATLEMNRLGYAHRSIRLCEDFNAFFSPRCTAQKMLEDLSQVTAKSGVSKAEFVAVVKYTTGWRRWEHWRLE